MKIVYNGQRKNLNHIDGMIRGQYSDYFHLDMNVGDESLVPPIRKGKTKSYRPHHGQPNSKTRLKWARKGKA